MFSSAVPYKNQRYDDLKRECIKDKKLFEDPEFPAVNTSLYYSKPLPSSVQWKRPGVSDNHVSGHSPDISLMFWIQEL